MLHEPQVYPRIRGKVAARALDVEIAALADAQHGVVARWQLTERGFSNGAIDRRLERRQLRVVHRGVFAVGHRVLVLEGRWMAAVLAGGAGAVLSHRAAGAHHELIRASSGAIDVMAQTRRTSRPGIRLHQRALPDDEWAIHEGIPATTVARTLLDLAEVLSPPRLRQALNVAEQRRLADSPSLPALIERYPRRRGVAKLKAILAAGRIGADIARSELELEFQDFLHMRGLPLPEMNAIVEVGGRRLEVDCLWRDARFVVELDSRAHHAGWEAAEADRARDLALLSAGLRCARVTARKLRRDADRLEAQLRRALRAS
jgi:hypothetical protein